MKNFDVNKEFIQHLQKENEELKSKVKKLEDELAYERLIKNSEKIQPIEPYPSIPPSPWYYEPWWEKGPTCNSIVCEVR